MPIEVSCPSCGTKFRAPDHKAGKKAKCGKCGGRVRIPGSASGASSVGESQMLSAIAMPPVSPLPDENESVPMASAVDEPDSKPHPLPPNNPEPELLSLDDEPAPGSPAAANDPFAFSGGHVPLPSTPSKPKQKAIEPAATKSEAEASHGRYVRPGQSRSSKTLLYAGIVGATTIAIAVVAVIVALNKMKPTEQAKATEKSDEPPGKTPEIVPPTGTGVPATKEGKSSPVRPKTGAPPAMFTLPRGTRELKISPPAAKPELTQRPSGGPITIDVPFTKLKRFFPPENRVQNDAVVVWQVGDAPGKYSVDTYSGTVGNRVGRIEFDGDAGSPLCDVSTDGQMFVAAAAGKITVWNLADKSKAVEGFDPYAEKPEHKKSGLAAVYFGPQSSRLVTVSSAGAVHLFDLGKMKVIGEFVPRGALGKIVAGKNVAISQTRISIALAAGGELYQIRAVDDLPLDWKYELGEVGRPLAIAIAGFAGGIGGTAFAFETAAKEKAIIFCTSDVQPKRIILKWPEAGEPTDIAWAGSSFATISTTRGAVWVDTEAKAFLPLAMVEAQGGMTLHGATELSNWYVIPKPGDAAKSLLLELAVPVANFIDFRNAAEAKQPLATLRLDAMGLWK